MEIEKVKAIIEEKYSELTSEVIAELMRLAPDAVSADDETDFANAWDVFASQAQNGEGLHDDNYEQLVDDLCLAQIDTLSDTELKLLWLGSGGYVEWHSEDPLLFPSEEQMVDEVLEEMYSWIEQKAEDLDLEDALLDDEEYDDEEWDDEEEDDGPPPSVH